MLAILAYCHVAYMFSVSRNRILDSKQLKEENRMDYFTSIYFYQRSNHNGKIILLQKNQRFLSYKKFCSAICLPVDKFESLGLGGSVVEGKAVGDEVNSEGNLWSCNYQDHYQTYSMVLFWSYFCQVLEKILSVLQIWLKVTDSIVSLMSLLNVL